MSAFRSGLVITWPLVINCVCPDVGDVLSVAVEYFSVHQILWQIYTTSRNSGGPWLGVDVGSFFRRRGGSMIFTKFDLGGELLERETSGWACPPASLAP